VSAGYKWINYALSLHKTGLKGTTLPIALILATYADEEGRAWPSVELLAFGCGFSKRTVFRGLARLRELGIVDWERTRGRGNRSKYRFTGKALAEIVI